MTQKIYFNQSCKYPFDLDKVPIRRTGLPLV